MFRKEAIESNKTKWQGKAIIFPGMPIWLVAFFCIFFIAAFLLFICCFSYSRRINVSGEISSIPKPVRVYSNVQGIISKKFFDVGNKVNPGDVVYQIDVSKSTNGGVVSDNQRININNQISQVKNIIASLKNSKKNTLEMLAKQKNKYLSAYDMSSTALQVATEGANIMKANMDKYKKYQSMGLINKDQLINQESLYYQQKINVFNLSRDDIQNSLRMIELDSQIQTQAAEFDNQIYKMELELYNLKKELINTDVSSDLMVKSDINGKIDSLGFYPGQMVNPGDVLFQVIPDKISYYSFIAWVPNSAIPYISIGDKVNLRYEAFPADKFGQFSGKVVFVSKIPASRQEILTYQVNPSEIINSVTSYYKVIIMPEKQKILYHGNEISLTNGMKASCTIFLESRRIYQWILSPYYDMRYSLVGKVK